MRLQHGQACHAMPFNGLVGPGCDPGAVHNLTRRRRRMRLAVLGGSGWIDPFELFR
jgi:hypothetical protein